MVYEWEGPVPIGPGFPYNGAYLAYHDRRRAAGASAQRLDFSALIEAYTAAIREPVTARASTGSLSLLGRLAKHLVGRRDGFERAIDRLLENGDTRNGTAFVAGPFPAAGDDQSEEEMEAAIEAALEMLSQRTPPSAPGMVHIGVLDVGIAFVNARFRYREEGVEASVPDKTRFEFLWLQDRTATGADGKPIGHRFLGGTILLRDHIDALIQDHWDPTTGGLDELAIYALFSPKDARRERDVLKTRFAHGTQVLDLMAGYPAEADASETAKHRPIYAVDLAARVVADTSGGTMPPSALTGLAMLLAASDRDERRVDAPAAPPMVVNISFAYSNGPDDGAHPLVRAIDLLLALAKRYGNREIKATVPMGNHLQDRLHAVLRPEDWADEAPVLTWQVLPDDRTASFIELWSPRAAVAAERPAHVIALQPPDAASPLAAPTAPASCNVFYRLKRHGVEIGRVYYLRYTDRFPRLDAPEAPPGHYQRIIVALRHTSDIVTDSDPAPSGRWGLRVERAGTGAPEEAEPLRLWIARDDTLLTFRPLGRQSHFVDSEYRQFDPPLGDLGRQVQEPDALVQRAGTASVLATGGTASPDKALVAGVEATRDPGQASGVVPYRLSGIFDPASLEPPLPQPLQGRCEEGRSTGGVLAAATFGRATVRFGGTSASAAIVARAMADALAAGGCGPGPNTVVPGYRRRLHY